jgi:hypothetical protein
MFKYKNHLSFYELINLINYAVELKFTEYNSPNYFKLSTYNNYDNLTPIISSLTVQKSSTIQSSILLSIFRNNFLKTKNNTLDTKIETLKDFLNVDNNIIKVPTNHNNDKLVLYDKYNYDKFLYYKYTSHEHEYPSSINFRHTYINNHIENFETTCEIGNLNYDYIILLNNLLYTMFDWNYSTNVLETVDYISELNYDDIMPHDGFKNNYRNYLHYSEPFIKNITNINLPVDFINEATQIIIQNSIKLDILLNDIIAYLTSTSELFNVYINEITTDNETTTNESSTIDSHNKITSPITKTLTADKNDTININANNRTVDYIINDSSDIDNINNLKKNKYADKLVYNEDTQNNTNVNEYNETLIESENVTNETFNRNVDDSRTKTNNSTFKRYKGIDIDIKTYQEIIKEIINIPNKMYDFLRLGIS